MNLFELWCEKSLILSPRQAAESLSQQFAEGKVETGRICRAIEMLGFSGATASTVADAVALLPEAASPRRLPLPTPSGRRSLKR